MSHSPLQADLLLPSVSRLGTFYSESENIQTKRETWRKATEAERSTTIMSVYKRGETWWYKFKFAGQTIRESAKTGSKTVAISAERIRRRELEEGFNGISKPQRAQLFTLAVENWLEAKKAHLSPRSVTIERLNLKHLKPFFGGLLLCDIKADDIAAYQSERMREEAAPKTINLEVGTLRAILRKHRLWANIQPDVQMLRASEYVGRALTQIEEKTLLNECRKSRSQSLYIVASR
jgi:Phage integrase, N-terminal SAM-like domain